MARLADADKRITAAVQAIPEATARILVIDIERRAGLAYVFDPRMPSYIHPSRWQRKPELLCFAAKWMGESKVEFRAAWNNAELMVKRSWELYDQADIVLTYNGVNFDNKHLLDEWTARGWFEPSPYKNIDLFKVNKARFGWESKSLDYLCESLGIPGKQHKYDPAEAEACMAGDRSAQREMRAYNIGDIDILETAYGRLLPNIWNHPHVATSSELRCNRCASDDLKRLPKDYRADVMARPAYRCGNCGGIVTDTQNGRRVGRTRGVR